MILLRGILDEIFDFGQWTTTFHQFFRVIAEDICSLHSLKHFFKIILFSLSQSIVEFHSISLIFLIFGLNLKIILLINSLKKLANIGLNISLLRPQYFLLTFPSSFLLIILNHQTLILYLCHSKYLQSLLIRLNKIHHRAVLNPIQNRVLIKQCSLLKTQEKLWLMILEVFILSQFLELPPKSIKSKLILQILWSLIPLLLALLQIFLQLQLQSSKKDNIVIHGLAVHHRTWLYFIPDYYRESLL